MGWARADPSRGCPALCQDDTDPWIGSGLSDTSVAQDTEELLTVAASDVGQHTRFHVITGVLEELVLSLKMEGVKLSLKVLLFLEQWSPNFF